MFSPNLMQQIANYLVTRPWSEVNGLLAAIEQEHQAAKAAEAKAAAPAVVEDA